MFPIVRETETVLEPKEPPPPPPSPFPSSPRYIFRPISHLSIKTTHIIGKANAESQRWKRASFVNALAQK